MGVISSTFIKCRLKGCKNQNKLRSALCGHEIYIYPARRAERYFIAYNGLEIAVLIAVR
jgi:hypothetical protein